MELGVDSESVLWISSIPWELDKNANSQAPPQTD